MIKLFNLILVAFSLNTYAINVNNLDFQVKQLCPAYLSKNKKTNPDNLMVSPGSIYPVREINKISPDWYRIEMHSPYSLRWVSDECGIVKQNAQFKKSCDRAGNADSYVLALSSQPGFCETYGYEAGKPECRKLSKDSYQANHLTLHGLWPNMNFCGQRYGFCNVTPQTNHCDYEPLSLAPQIASELKKLMPSFNYGSCLERHEWNKHGSCQFLSVDDYFSLAMRLTKEVDNSPLGNYLTNHQGQAVRLSVLRDMIDKTFGSSNREKIYLGCKNNVLVDIYIQLPADLNVASIVDLVNEAPNNHARDLCGKTVIISHFNQDSWF